VQQYQVAFPLIVLPVTGWATTMGSGADRAGLAAVPYDTVGATAPGVGTTGTWSVSTPIEGPISCRLSAAEASRPARPRSRRETGPLAAARSCRVSGAMGVADRALSGTTIAMTIAKATVRTATRRRRSGNRILAG
jgi:hypothetical protein